MNTRVVLPIDSYMRSIMESLANNAVTIVAAETGAGKTTRIPQAILEMWRTVPVIMTQPRRLPIRTNGARIAEELGCKPGGLVGWRLFGETPVVSDETRLTLVVDQSLINQITRAKRLPRGVIIVDEAHERSIQCDLLLGLIKQYLPNSPNTRVLVTSATIDTEKFSAFFNGAPIIEVPGRCFPVETVVVRLKDREHHTEGAARVATTLMEQYALTGALPLGNGSLATSGSILVLLPGEDDITHVTKKIASQMKHLGAESRFEIMTCYGKSTPEEQAAIQVPVAEGVLRFVVGTEVLRGSVTVESTIGVIDSLQIKRLMVNAHGVGSLVKITVSKAEADQGKGRAGRTQCGIYYVLSFGNEYETLDPYPQPAMLREAISSVLLQIAATGLRVRTFPFIDAPSIEHMDAALVRLQKIGALDTNEQITNVGRVLVRLSLAPERAVTLLRADELDVLPETVVVAAALEVDGLFHRPKERTGIVTVDESVACELLACMVPDVLDNTVWYPSERREADEIDLTILPPWMVAKEGLFEVDCSDSDFPYREGARWIADFIRTQWAGESRSDFVAIVRAYRAFKTEERQLMENAQLRRAKRDSLLRGWCINHGINFKRLRLAEQAMRQIKSDLAGVSVECPESLAAEREFDTDALTKALLSGLFAGVAIRTDKQFTGLSGGFSLAHGSAAAGSSELVLVGGVRKTMSETMFADVAAPIDIDWLQEILPQLCEVLDSQDATVDYETRKVTSVAEHRFNGLLLWRSRPAFDADLTDATFGRLIRLEEAAIELRNQAYAILEREHDNIRLSNELYDRLCMFDVDDDRLPTSVDDLEAWIAAVRTVIMSVEACLSRQTAPGRTMSSRLSGRLLGS